MKSGARVVVDDVATSPVFVGTPSLDVLLTARARGVQSTPLVSRTSCAIRSPPSWPGRGCCAPGLVAARIGASAPYDRARGQLSRLADDLLDVSRITTGRVTLRHETRDLRKVIKRALETSRPLFEARKHRLDFDLPRKPLRICGDSAVNSRRASCRRGR